MGYRPSCSQKEGKKKHISEFSNAFSIVSYQQRLDRGTKWEIRQRISETEKDEQKEHRGRAQSTSADVHKQRQVINLNSSCTFDVCLMLAWAWDMSLSVHNRLASHSSEVDQDVQLHCSSSSEAEPEKAVLQPESPPLTSAFSLSTSFEEDVLDLKWRQSHRALLCPPTSVLSPLLCCFGWSSFLFCFFLLLSSDTLALFPTYPGILSPRSADEMGAVEVWSHVCVRVWLFSWAVPPLSRRVSAVCVAPQQITQRGCVRCRGAFRLLQELWDAGLILNHKLNVNLCTKAWENSLHSQLPLTLQELMCCILCDYFRSTFKYCMICICVHLFIHKSAHMQAYMPVWLVMHIYRYIIKINFIPIFSKSMIFDFMLCTFSPILFPLSVVNRLDRPGRSLPQVPSATVLHSSRRPTATRFWCLSVAAMIVVHVRLQW